MCSCQHLLSAGPPQLSLPSVTAWTCAVERFWPLQMFSLHRLGPCSLHLITWVSPSAFSNNAPQLASVGEPGMKQLVKAKKPENCYLGWLCLHRAVRGQLPFSPLHKIKGDTKRNGKHHNKSSLLIAMIVPRKTHHFLAINLAYWQWNFGHR